MSGPWHDFCVSDVDGPQRPIELAKGGDAMTSTTTAADARAWLEHVHAMIREHQIRTVRVCAQDLTNVARARYVSTRHFLEQLEGGHLTFPSALFGFTTSADVLPGPDGVSFDGGFPSWQLVPDLRTFSVLPYAPGVARVIADVYAGDDAPLAYAPREVLRRVLARLAHHGLRVQGSFEYEFYLFRAEDGSPAWMGRQCFAETRQAEVEPVLLAILQALQELGAGPEVANTEYGPGQFEVSNAPFWDIEIADMAFYYRTSIREVAAQHGYRATFMSKPLANGSGSGAHLHHSLFDEEGRNVFFDPAAPDGLSALCRSFIAGQLAHAGAITAVCCGTVNAYKRLVPHAFAPTRAVWGHEHRSAMVRVPHARGVHTRLENRIPGADADPYLSLAVILAAGLDGVERGLVPPPPVARDPEADDEAPALPRTMEQGLRVLEEDHWLRETLGDTTIERLYALRQAEYAQFLQHITDWEKQTYAQLW